MTGSVAQGLGAAVGAALVYGTVPLAQARAARTAPPGRGIGLRLILELARRPWWLAGLACQVGGFVLEAVAFSAAPATLVAPVLACDMLVFILLCWPVLGTRPSSRSLVGAGFMGGGVALLGAAFAAGSSLGARADDVELVCFGAAAVAVGGLAALFARSRVRARRSTTAAVLALASGISYGFGTLATRQVGRTFSLDSPYDLLATPTPYVLAVCSVVGIALMQRSLQVDPVVTYPVTSGSSALLPVLMGVAVLGEGVPNGGFTPLFAVALAVLAVGVALLGAGRSSPGRSGAENEVEEADEMAAR